MLSGKVPFQPDYYMAHSAHTIMKNIMSGEVSFTGDEWTGVSESAKDLIQGKCVLSVCVCLCVEYATN